MALPNFVLRGLEEPTGLLAGFWAWIFNKNNRPENEAAVRALELQGDECVLDLGFGGGASFPPLLSALPDGRIVGVEPADEMIERARNNWPDEVSSGRLDLQTGSASTLGLPEASVDAALTINTVYFWSDLREGFEEIRRVLVPGGPLVIGIVENDVLQELGFEKMGYRLESPEAYARGLEDCGYVNLEIQRLDFEKPCHLVLGQTSVS